MESNILIGSHVSMSGKEMLLGSVKEALSYDANTFMFYTGAPQNTRRKDIRDLNIEAAKQLMKEHNISTFVVHAPYIINLANTVNPDTFQLAVDFLSVEITRTDACGSPVLVLHPGSHVGAGEEVGIKKIIEGLNEVITKDMNCVIALETMAGKGSELGRSFEELAAIYEGVHHNDKLRVCFDTCHVNDAGYDIVNNLDGVLTEFDKILGLNQIAAIHVNDSKNVLGAGKDRHANIGDGTIGLDTLRTIVHLPEFAAVPKILETPYITLEDGSKVPPYKEEIALLRQPPVS
ncbi:MAG: deoxyribonuclease IV [Lachnospiraceae bacterium]|nr:deoxyribonuclease IV [Lachnospiraceae bacterium]